MKTTKRFLPIRVFNPIAALNLSTIRPINKLLNHHKRKRNE